MLILAGYLADVGCRIAYSGLYLAVCWVVSLKGMRVLKRDFTVNTESSNSSRSIDFGQGLVLCVCG